MNDRNLRKAIAQFIENTRDEDGAQSFVWLADRGVMVHLDTCTSLELVNAADEWLAMELDRLNTELRRVRAREQGEPSTQTERSTTQ